MRAWDCFSGVPAVGAATTAGGSGGENGAPAELTGATAPTRTSRPRRLLMIDYFFPPMSGSGVQRTLGYVRHLGRFGWEPVVLTVRAGEHFAYDPALLDLVPRDTRVERTASIEPVRFAKHVIGAASRTRRARGTGPGGDGRPVWQGGAWLSRLERQILFPDRRIGWLPFALARAAALHRRRRIDAVYSTSTFVTSHLVAYALHTLYGIPWVADFQDPWVEELPGALHRRMGRVLERSILRTAERVTFTTEPLRDAFRDRYPGVPAHKLVAIPMGFHPEAFETIVPERRTKFTITHFGGFYAPRSPRSFLEALARFAGREPGAAGRVEVRLFGNFDPPMLRVTEGLLRERQLAGLVRLEGIVPYAAGLTQLVSSDVLLLVTAADRSGAIQVPSKVYEYLGAGRPILALAPQGAVAQIVREAGAGVVVDVQDVEGIAAAIGAFYQNWREGRAWIRADQKTAERFAWRELTRRFAATVEEARADGGAASVARSGA